MGKPIQSQNFSSQKIQEPKTAPRVAEAKEKSSKEKTKEAKEKLANLVLSKFRASQLYPVGGATIFLEAEITNDGDKESGPFEFVVNKGSKGKQTVHINNLEPGESTRIKVEPLITDPLHIPVDYKVEAKVDPDNRIKESHEWDNSKELTIRAAPMPSLKTVPIKPTPMPDKLKTISMVPVWDLSKEEVKEMFPHIPAKIEQRIKDGETKPDLEIMVFEPTRWDVTGGQNVWFDIVVVNSGVKETQPFDIELDKGKGFDRVDTFLVDRNLKQGEGIIIRDAGPLMTDPLPTPNSYFVKLIVDPAEQVEEIDKNNNFQVEIINAAPNPQGLKLPKSVDQI